MLKKDNLTDVVKAIVYIVLGVLLCCSVIDANTLPNWLVSISLMVAGGVLLLTSIIAFKTLIGTDSGTSGVLLFAVGLFLLPSLPNYQPLNWVWGAALLMMIFGVAYMIEGLLGLVSKRNAAANIFLLIFGAAVFALGICLWLIDDFRQFAGLMLGIMLIVYGTIKLIAILTHKDIYIVHTSK